MKVVQINVTCGNGSTGEICVGISRILSEHNIENRIFFSSGESDYSLGIKYMSSIYTKIQALKSRVFGNYGFNSHFVTKRLILALEKEKPDIVILHNLHGHNCQLDILLSFLKKKQIKVVWVFHDCWAFTGYCPHYDMIGCDLWKKGCHDCPLKKEFSWFLDRSSEMYQKKKSLISGMNMIIVTPSDWMKHQAEQSFFSGYRVERIYNGIDLSDFYPRKSTIKKKLKCENNTIILGVAYQWNDRKGFDVFLRLAEVLPDNYKIVLVGRVEPSEAALPENVIIIQRTDNKEELAELYSAADVFVNPTREETLGLTNIEAMACGTPVVVFCSGGSVETITDETGIIVEKDDFDSLYKAVVSVANKKFSTEHLIEQANRFTVNKMLLGYLKLIQRL